MKLKTKSLLLVGALILAGCAGTGGLGGVGADASGFGNANDPTSQAYFLQTIGDRVFFAVNESSLSDQGRVVLGNQAAWLISNTEFTAIIEGHADEQGTSEYNLALGARRANAVVEFLISQGVPADRMQTVTYGKERPVGICSEELCYSQNRRAVTVIAAGALG
ncbi:MAG: peptidoglycan-associated lipoprotein Pal [Paracoccaceae bacterium]